MTYLTFKNLVLLGCVVCMRGFSNNRKSLKNFPIYLFLKTHVSRPMQFKPLVHQTWPPNCPCSIFLSLTCFVREGCLLIFLTENVYIFWYFSKYFNQ